MKATNTSALTRLSSALLGTGALMLSPLSVAAEPEISFYGLIDVYAGTIKSEGADQKRVPVVNPSGLTTSFIGVKSSIDLGEGLTGLVSVESFLRPDVGDDGRSDTDKFFARNAFVGLSGSAGTVKIGRNTTPYFISTITSNPFGGSFGFGPSIKHSFLGGLNGDSGWSNSVLYETPKLGGFNASLLYSAGEVQGEDGAAKMGASAFYSVGKFSGTLAWQSVDALADSSTASPDDTQTATLLGLSYDFDVLKAFAQYQMMETEVAATPTKDYDTYQLGVSVPVPGEASVWLSYAMTDISAATDTDRDTYALGYNKKMAKQVDLYAVAYHDDKSDEASSASTIAVGGRFRF